MKAFRWMTFPIAAVALGFGPVMMTGCEDDNDVEDAVDDTGDALEDGAEDLEDGAEDIGDDIEDSVD